MDDAAAHEFGGEHTQEKLEAVGNYLPAYTTALGKLFTLYYVDAFAGTGECDITVGDKKIRVQGSASIALNCTLLFTSSSSSRKSLVARERSGNSPNVHKVGTSALCRATQTLKFQPT